MNFAPARIISRQPGGANDSLDVEPFHSFIAVDFLHVADEDGIIEPQPWAKIAQRLRNFADEQTQLDAQWGGVLFPQVFAIALLPVFMHIVPIGDLASLRDALQHAPRRHFLAAADGTQTSRPQSFQPQSLQLARQRNKAALAARQKRDERLHRGRTLPGDAFGLALPTLLQQRLDTPLAGGVDSILNALSRRVRQRLDAAFDFLIFQRGITQDRFHVPRFEPVQLAGQPEIDPRLRSMTAMKLRAPLFPSGQQRSAFSLSAGQQRRESGRISLCGIEPVFLDVFDDACRLFAANAEQIGQLAARDTLLFAQLPHTRAKLVGQSGELTLLLTTPQPFQRPYFLLRA